MPVVRVTSSFCDPYTGGLTEFSVQPGTVNTMYRELGERFPGLAEHLRKRAAVAIDGTIYQNPFMQQIGEDTDVVILPRIGGG